MLVNKSILLLLLLSILWLSDLRAQIAVSAMPGPSGIYLTLGRNIPSGKNILLYSIERRENQGEWKKIAVVRTPLAFTAFKEEIEKAARLLPSQPAMPEARLKNLYERAIVTGMVDSLKAWNMPYSVRIALGFMYHDATALKGKAFQYRITETSAEGKENPGILTDTLSMPYKARYDEVLLSESSLTMKGVYIRWFSAGKNPAPVFMVNRYEGQQTISAGGAIGKFSKNDTTYYTFRDSTQKLAEGKDLVYALVPFDKFGNTGTTSQKIMFTHDAFNRADFLYTRVNMLEDGTGYRLSWKFSDEGTANSMEVYRSEKPDRGFIRLAVLSNSDTLYADTRIFPSKEYYYYVQAIAKTGKRFKPGTTVFAPAYEFKKLAAPVISAAEGVPGGIKLTIGFADERVTHFRVFRAEGTSSAWVAITEPLVRTGNVCTYTDTDPALSPKLLYSYVVRAEESGKSISGLSEKVTASPLPK